MEGIGVIPGVVHHFRAAVEIGAKDEVVRIGKVHHSLRFGLDGALVEATVIFWIVAVEVYAVGVVAAGVGHGVVATVVSAVGIGIGSDVELHRVDDIGETGIGSILAEEGVDEAQHQDPAGGLIAVHGAGKQHFRLLLFAGNVV